MRIRMLNWAVLCNLALACCATQAAAATLPKPAAAPVHYNLPARVIRSAQAVPKSVKPVPAVKKSGSSVIRCQVLWVD